MTHSKQEEVSWGEIAELFHDTYETLAPAYGYETREDTKQFDPQSKNGKLMTAVVKSVIEHNFLPKAHIKAVVEQRKRKFTSSGAGPESIPYEEYEDCAWNAALADVLSSLGLNEEIK